MNKRYNILLSEQSRAKTWPGLVIPQKNPLLYNDEGKARGDAS